MQPNWKKSKDGIFRDTTGVHEAEAEIAKKGKIYRFPLERLKIVSREGTDYLVPFTYDPIECLHRIGDYVPWFVGDLSVVAQSVGLYLDDLVEALCSRSAGRRLIAYKAVGEYHGWLNFDGYPLSVGDR
jgi:hypothetical protein